LRRAVIPDRLDPLLRALRLAIAAAHDRDDVEYGTHIFLRRVYNPWAAMTVP
jgi:hypothetical protein